MRNKRTDLSNKEIAKTISINQIKTLLAVGAYNSAIIYIIWQILNRIQSILMKNFLRENLNILNPPITKATQNIWRIWIYK